METILNWLTLIGQWIIKLLPPEFVLDLERTLPVWAIGLGAVVIMAFVLKLVTSLIFKILLWGALIIVFFIILQSFNIPILDILLRLGK